MFPTLTRDDYCSPEIFELERQRIFRPSWLVAARASTLAPGSRRVVTLLGEQVLLTRALDGAIHAFANTCRHRGAQLCERDVASTQGSMMCPYHAWTYALDGTLIATPHLADDDVDKATLSLWRYPVHEWLGFVFVCLTDTPPDFDAWVADFGRELSPLARFPLADLDVAVTTSATVAANWKILIENYQECLHCTRVHPELVDIIPTYRDGWVLEDGRDDGGVTLRDGSTSLASGGHTVLPLLPGMSGIDATSYFGGTVYPNAFVDVSGTCVIVSTMFPIDATSTTVVAEYLFAPDTIDAADFDPTPVVDFNELVAAQDFAVCEGVQRGVSSPRFSGGVLTSKDKLVIHYTKRYLRARGDLPSRSAEATTFNDRR